MNNPNYKIIIVDDHKLFADGLEQIIKNIGGFDVIAKISNGKLLMQELTRLRPDIILLDIHMPLMDGFEAAKAIKMKWGHIKIIFISMYYDQRYRTFIRDNNIEGYMIKDMGTAQLKEALQQVAEGKQLFILPPEITAAAVKKPETDFVKIYKLTRTEIEIIRLVAGGLSTKMIAEKRNLSILTVETHRKNIFRKLNARNLAEVTAFALIQGIVKN